MLDDKHGHSYYNPLVKIVSTVDWFKHRRLHGEVPTDAGYVTPAEQEAKFYDQSTATTETVANQ